MDASRRRFVLTGIGLTAGAGAAMAQPATTTVVSAGDAGANNFAAFRGHIVAQTRTRMFAFIHIANHRLAGSPVPELCNIDFAQVDAAAKALAVNADIALGVKVRISENLVGKRFRATRRGCRTSPGS